MFNFLELSCSNAYGYAAFYQIKPSVIYDLTFQLNTDLCVFISKYYVFNHV